MEPQSLIQLYSDHFGTAPRSVERLPGAGSNRIYYRLYPATTSSLPVVIGVVGTQREENQSFCQLSRHFTALHLPVPQVFAVSADAMCYLQEDLGSTSLFDVLRESREKGEIDAKAIALLEQVMADLPRFQFEAASEEVYACCYPQRYFDRRTVHFDLNYFKYCFLKLRGVEFNEMRLEDDFDRLCHDLLAVKEVGFMYRDFQARNVMLRDGHPYYIDFQGGRRGPIHYDVASFLWQASAHYSASLRLHLIDVYLDALSAYLTLDKETFLRQLRLFVFFRTLQVLGAYGFRGLWERKQHFLDSIPQALENMRALLKTGISRPYPQLETVAFMLIKTM